MLNSYIKRGDNIEGIIRENELLRIVNRNMKKMLQEIIIKCASTISSFDEDFNFTFNDQNDVMKMG